jgi:hypothetical protein
MNNQTLRSLSILLVAVSFFFTSCKKDKCEQTVTYKAFVPIYMSYEELRNSVKSEAPQTLKNPGKIYLKGNYIFVNEVDKGIHVIDNSNPSSPQNIAFINIPGNIDLAAWGDVLYADSYTDLLALDISNPQNISVLSRNENAVPYRSYTNGTYVDPQKGVVIDWEEKMVTEKIGEDCGNNGGYYGRGGWLEGDVMNSSSGGFIPNSFSASTGSPNMGGSMARFAVTANTLYIVDHNSLKVYSLSNPSTPTSLGSTTVGQNIETIFPHRNHLFIGSSAGMFIYNINNPSAPVFVSSYAHVFACDPVAVDDEYAYITLRSGTPCNNSLNQLEVVNIQNLSTPTLVNTVPMSNPHGVGIDNHTLFICDRPEGLRVFNATDVTNIANSQVALFPTINANDVIPFNNRLLMISEDGLYQYDYRDIQNIALLSRIPVVK